MSQAPDHESVRAWSALRGAAARVDGEPQLVAALQSLRRRLPGDENFGDPLSTAGETTLGFLARRVSGLQPPERESALSELSLAGLQLWQSVSEGIGRGRGEENLALVFTDLVDFSRWVLAAGDSAAVDVLRAVADAVDQPIEDRGGRIQKRLGDGLLATFTDAPTAVEAALHVQEALGELDWMATGRGCGRASIGAGRASWAGSIWVRTSASPSRWARGLAPVRCWPPNPSCLS